MTDFLNVKRKILLLIAFALFIINIFSWKYVFLFSQNHYLKIDFLDIGQGDSIFIETPSMRHILIDGGPDSKVLSKLSKELPFWERNLDAIILTHPDADHLNGLISVLQNCRTFAFINCQ